jgi:putative ABC transport system substrate-binding protein
LGYVEGKNFATELRVNPDSLTQAAADLVGLNVNVIFAGGPAVLAAASKATSSIPVVGIDLESDPIAKGYVRSLGHPGGNVTGMFLDIPELSGKQVQLLKQVVPQLSRMESLAFRASMHCNLKRPRPRRGHSTLRLKFAEVQVTDDSREL